MTRTLLNTTAAVAALVVASAASSARAEIAEWFETLAKAEHSHSLSVCISNSRPTPTDQMTAISSLNSGKIAIENSAGEIVLERGYTAPPFQFTCTEFPFSVLVRDPETTREVIVRVRVTPLMGANKLETGGQTIRPSTIRITVRDDETGTEMHEVGHWVGWWQ